MATSTALRKLNIDGQLSEQLNTTCISEKGRDFILVYLENKGIRSLDDVTQADLVDFRHYANITATGNQKAKSWYGGLLGQAVFTYLIGNAGEEIEEPSRSSVLILANECISDIAIRNKTVGYLLMFGVRDIKDVDYEIREQYEAYLTETISHRKVREYIKALDRIVLEHIKKEGEKPFAKKELRYSPKKLFLSYHPDFAIAQSFYYVQDKRELVFDFSLPGPDKVKKQIFQMLNYVLDTVSDPKDRRERFLLPLNTLYHFCLDNGINDIEQMTKAQAEAYRESIDGAVGTKTDAYMQIMRNTRRYLFLAAQETNWDARVWFLERFTFSDGRVNPAREVLTFDFSDIENADNCRLFQVYMRYLLGISTKKTVQTIRGAYYHILDFIRYMDATERSITEVTKEIMEEYIHFLDGRPIQPETYNKALVDIMGFLEYLVSKKEIVMPLICVEYFFKKTYEKHHDRTVPEAEFNRNLRVIMGFPAHLQIMCLIIFTTGLRISEVCALHGNALDHDGKDAWIKVYQPKMKADKRIPIPDIVYEIVTKYVTDNHIGAGEYIFQNKRGGAYDADTFSKQVNDCFKEAGIQDYRFRPHDYRHTLASRFYSEGIMVPVIRDYLGHRDARMTQQYIDEMQLIVDGLNKAYFQEKSKQEEQEKQAQ